MTGLSTRQRGPHNWDEFAGLGEEDLRELIEGELVEVEVPTDIHEHIVAMLAYFFTAWARPLKAGFVLVSGFKVRISERRGVMPDLQFYRKGNPAVRTRQGLVEGHPDLVVEVVSDTSGRYDRVTKLEYYASISVPEYWLVDPGARTVERLALRGTSYVVEESAGDGDVLRPGSFAGLAIPLAELWTLPDEPVA